MNFGFFYWIKTFKSGEMVELNFAENAHLLKIICEDTRFKYRDDPDVIVTVQPIDLEDQIIEPSARVIQWRKVWCSCGSQINRCNCKRSKK